MEDRTVLKLCCKLELFGHSPLQQKSQYNGYIYPKICFKQDCHHTRARVTTKESTTDSNSPQLFQYCLTPDGTKEDTRTKIMPSPRHWTLTSGLWIHNIIYKPYFVLETVGGKKITLRIHVGKRQSSERAVRRVLKKKPLSRWENIECTVTIILLLHRLEDGEQVKVCTFTFTEDRLSAAYRFLGTPHSRRVGGCGGVFIIFWCIFFFCEARAEKVPLFDFPPADWTVTYVMELLYLSILFI